MAKYLEEIGRQFETIGTVVIRGVPLDISADHPLRSKGYFPILSPTCVCVTEPCPCKDHNDLIIWLPDSGVRSREATEIKNKDGEALHEFHLIRDAELVTENFVSRKAASFDPRARRSGPSGVKFTGASFDSSSRYVCAGNTMYLVVEGPDGSGGTLFEYIAIGSCETTSS